MTESKSITEQQMKSWDQCPSAVHLAAQLEQLGGHVVSMHPRDRDATAQPSHGHRVTVDFPAVTP